VTGRTVIFLAAILIALTALLLLLAGAMLVRVGRALFLGLLLILVPVVRTAGLITHVFLQSFSERITALLEITGIARETFRLFQTEQGFLQAANFSGSRKTTSTVVPLPGSVRSVETPPICWPKVRMSRAPIPVFCPSAI
jgi:hypothetical protein